MRSRACRSCRRRSRGRTRHRALAPDFETVIGLRKSLRRGLRPRRDQGGLVVVDVGEAEPRRPSRRHLAGLVQRELAAEGRDGGELRGGRWSGRRRSRPGRFAVSPSAAPCMRMKIVPAEGGSETVAPVACVEKLLSPGNSYSSFDESPDAPKNCSLLSQSRSTAVRLSVRALEDVGDPADVAVVILGDRAVVGHARGDEGRAARRWSADRSPSVHLTSGSVSWIDDVAGRLVDGVRVGQRREAGGARVDEERLGRARTRSRRRSAAPSASAWLGVSALSRPALHANVTVVFAYVGSYRKPS